MMTAGKKNEPVDFIFELWFAGDPQKYNFNHRTAAIQCHAGGQSIRYIR